MSEGGGTANVNINVGVATTGEQSIVDLQRKVGELESALKRAMRAGADGGKQAADGINQAKAATQGLESVVAKLGPTMAAAFGAAAISQFAQNMSQATEKLQRELLTFEQRLQQVASATGLTGGQIRTAAADIQRANPQVDEMRALALVERAAGTARGPQEQGIALQAARAVGSMRGIGPAQQEGMVELTARMAMADPGADVNQLAQTAFTYTQGLGSVPVAPGFKGFEQAAGLPGDRAENMRYAMAIYASATRAGQSPELINQVVKGAAALPMGTGVERMRAIMAGSGQLEAEAANALRAIPAGYMEESMALLRPTTPTNYMQPGARTLEDLDAERRLNEQGWRSDDFGGRYGRNLARLRTTRVGQNIEAIPEVGPILPMIAATVGALLPSTAPQNVAAPGIAQPPAVNVNVNVQVDNSGSVSVQDEVN